MTFNKPRIALRNGYWRCRDYRAEGVSVHSPEHAYLIWKSQVRQVLLHMQNNSAKQLLYVAWRPA